MISTRGEKGARPSSSGWLVKVRLAVVSVSMFAFALVFLSAASAGSSRPHATAPLLRYGIVGAVTTIDTGKNQTPLGDLMYDFLSLRGPNGQVLPGLALSVTQPSPAVYVYHLRHGVQFWDGNEMTAVDVANSLNYLRYPGNLDSTQFQEIRSIVPRSRYTVVVTLRSPDSGFKYLFTYSGEIWEKKFQDANRATFGDPSTLTMATGPYIIKSLDPNTGAELDANPHYWGGKPPIAHISATFFTSEQSEALAFRAGAIDVAWPGDPKTFASTANTTLLSAPSNQLGFLAMNVKQPPWNDVHVRRAVAYALNRQAIISAFGDYARPDYSLIPPAVLGQLAPTVKVNALIKSLPTYPYNLAKAKQEMAKSAYPNGVTATWNEWNRGTWVNVAQTIAAELSQIGIQLKVNALTSSDWFQQYETDAGFPIFFWKHDTVTGTDAGFIPGRDFMSTQAKGSGQDWSRFTSPSLDALIVSAAKATNPAKRFALYSKFLRIVQGQAVQVPLLLANQTLALSSKFTFPTFNGYLNPSIPWIMGVKPK